MPGVFGNSLFGNPADPLDGPAISYMTPAGAEMQKMQQAREMATRLELANAMAAYKGIQNPPPFGNTTQPLIHTPFGESVENFRPSANVEDKTGWFGGLQPNPALIDIIRKYLVPGMVAGDAGAAGTQGQ